jgi:uncharacterized iron-regulated membrane protein
MTVWNRWMRQPQTVWLRKAFFQVHLWTGIALGIYVLLISVSGSAIVFRNELYGSLFPGPTTVSISVEPLSKDALKQAARKAWPGYVVTFIWQARRPNQAIEIWMERDGWKKQRLFDPYTGEDLGRSKPYSIVVLSWLSDLHTNLLAGKSGRTVNGLLSILVCVLCLSGLVVWWPGLTRWRRSLAIDWKANWKRLNWDLHSAVGIWMFAFVFIWGFTGIYVSIPRPFQAIVDRYSPHIPEKVSIEAPQTDVQTLRVQTGVSDAPAPARRRGRRPPVKLSPGEKVLRWFYYLHFGNFGGWPVKALWVVLGLSPVLLFATGVLMWWNRVLSPEARSARRKHVPVLT